MKNKSLIKYTLTATGALIAAIVLYNILYVKAIPVIILIAFLFFFYQREKNYLKMLEKQKIRIDRDVDKINRGKHVRRRY